MKTRFLLTWGAAVSLLACHDAPTSPAPLTGGNARFERAAASQSGTGLIIHNVTSTPIPLLGDAVFNGDLVITQLALNAVGGLQVSGTLIGTVGALGQTINQNFTTDVLVSSSGNGNSCTALSLDLSPINVNVAGQIVSVDLTNVDATASAQGPLGHLLCVLTSALNKGLGGAVTALLNVINGILGGATPTPPTP